MRKREIHQAGMSPRKDRLITPPVLAKFDRKGFLPMKSEVMCIALKIVFLRFSSDIYSSQNATVAEVLLLRDCQKFCRH